MFNIEHSITELIEIYCVLTMTDGPEFGNRRINLGSRVQIIRAATFGLWFLGLRFVLFYYCKVDLIKFTYTEMGNDFSWAC
jgi:hypothetical protein